MVGILQAAIEFRVVAQKLAIAIVVISAFRWGTGPERMSALALLYLFVADLAYHAVFGAGVRLDWIDLGHLAIDATAAVGMVWIAVAANRMYTLWIGAFQIIAVQAHLARALETNFSPLAYAIMFTAPSYLQIGLLAGGVWSHYRRRQVYGNYRSWRISLPRLPETARPRWLRD